MESLFDRRDDDNRQFLVNVTRNGRHVALLSTCDAELLQILSSSLQSAGYTTHIDSTPSPLGRKKT